MLEELLSYDLSKITSVEDVRDLAVDLRVPTATREQLLTGFTIHGTGTLGRDLAESSVRAGLPLLGVSDSNPARWGTNIAGHMVGAPHTQGHTVVTAVFHVRAAMQALSDQGNEAVLSYYQLLLSFPDVFLPYWCLTRPDGIRAMATSALVTEAASRIEDAGSAVEFARQLASRCYIGVLDGSTPFGTRENEYFQGTMAAVSAGEVLLDLGAFDGDTVRRLFERGPDDVRAIAVEPDFDNYTKLRSVAAEFPSRVLPIHAAISESMQLTAFHEDSSAGSHVSEGASQLVPAVTVDSIYAAAPFSRVKMDIEGFESHALDGAFETLRKGHANWAIAAYHREDDLFALQRYFSKDYRMEVSSHAPRPWDSTVYFVKR